MIQKQSKNKKAIKMPRNHRWVEGGVFILPVALAPAHGVARASGVPHARLFWTATEDEREGDEQDEQDDRKAGFAAHEGSCVVDFQALYYRDTPLGMIQGTVCLSILSGSKCVIMKCYEIKRFAGNIYFV